MRGILFVLALVAALAAPARADHDEGGIAAYNRGDYATALRVLRPLAERGDVYGQYFLGLMYRDGRVAEVSDAATPKADFENRLKTHVEKSERRERHRKEALKWFRLAAEQGHLGAQYALGSMYYRDGIGGETEAIKWFRLAAERGHAQAQIVIGNMYEHGFAIVREKDYVRAHMWFNLAAMKGNKTAIERRDALSAKMTPAQIAEAEKLAREFKPTR